MKSGAKKTSYSVVLLVFLAAACSGWMWYSEKYARFPVHRLPNLAVFESWKLQRTRSDLASIRIALDAFKSHYGHLPFNSPQSDYQFSITLGHDLNGQLTDVYRRNSDRIVFWNIPAGEQRDGWGGVYHYHFDHDGDGRVDTGHRKVVGDYFVWSDGPDQINQEGTEDDIR
ncbi:MAG: hypothetical protein JNJ83_22110 [Verrucomicrobiaceae bacterium]|nr:hypothetical protein [Verrucomicrobiaceae bacterium]